MNAPVFFQLHNVRNFLAACRNGPVHGDVNHFPVMFINAHRAHALLLRPVCAGNTVFQQFQITLGPGITQRDGSPVQNPLEAL